MNSLRRRLALGLVMTCIVMAYDHMTIGIMNTPAAMLVYYGGAATIDLAMFYMVRYFVTEHLQRDIEALQIASIVANALGWVLYMAYAPPKFYEITITGINYVLAVRLLMGGGDVFNDSYWRGLVRGFVTRRQKRLAKEAK